MLEASNRINSKKDLKEWIYYENNKYTSGHKERYRDFLRLSERDILVYHQKLLRKTEYYTNVGNKFFALLYGIRLNHIQNKYAIHILASYLKSYTKFFNSVIEGQCKFVFDSVLNEKWNELG